MTTSRATLNEQNDTSFFERAFSLLKATFGEWQEDKASRLAAALAYYTIFALPPLLVIVIAVVGLFADPGQAQSRIVTEVRDLIGPGAADAVSTMIEETQDRDRSNIVATLLGLVTLILGATGVFGQLEDALNTIWDVQERDMGIWGMVKERFLSFAMVLGIGFLLLVSLVLSAAVSALGSTLGELFPGSGVLIWVLDFALSVGVITVLFASIYKVLPDVEIAWSDVWIGAAVTALLFAIGKLLLGLYLGRSGASSAYGAAGALVLLLLWIYYSAQILFLGAEFTQVYARRYGERIVSAVEAQDGSGGTAATAQPAAEQQRAQPTRRPTPVVPPLGQMLVPGRSRAPAPSGAPDTVYGEDVEVTVDDRRPERQARRAQRVVYPVLMALGMVAGLVISNVDKIVRRRA